MTYDPTKLPYRRCVGLCLINPQGLVLVAERRDCAGAWQMPQGGINLDEPPHETALRELKEEIGTDNATIIAQLSERTRYDFPEHMQYRHGVFRGKYRGQEQDWFALRFMGQDSEIDISGIHEADGPEFVAWKWVPLETTPAMIVEFKRPAYHQVVKAFTPITHAIENGDQIPAWSPPTKA